MARYELKDTDYSFNASLDPFLVLKRMGFTEQSLYQEGSIVRIHCPIHKDLIRKSMLIDSGEKTFKCQYSQCEAYEGGLLIELVAMYYDCGLDEVTRNLFGDDDKAQDLLFRGEMYINKGMHAEALPYLEQAVQLDPRNEITRGKLAALYLELGRKDDAYREYMLAAESYAVRGELEKTLAMYNILIILQPGAVKARKELSFLFARMGRPDAAAEQLKWVVDFYMQYGQARGAQETINSILELDPSSGMAYFLSAQLNQSQGKRVPAMQAYEKSAELFFGAREASRLEVLLDEAQALAPGNPRLKEFRRQLDGLKEELAAEKAADLLNKPEDENQDFIEWLHTVDEKLSKGVDAVSAVADQDVLEVARRTQRRTDSQLAPISALAGEPVSKTDTSEINPDDRRVAFCLSDMRELTPDQLEKMRQQLVGMFTEVRKTYEDGLLSDWEMRTIKDFYKAFCIAVDMHQRTAAGG